MQAVPWAQSAAWEQAGQPAHPLPLCRHPAKATRQADPPSMRLRQTQLGLLLHSLPAPGSGVQTSGATHDPFWQLPPAAQQELLQQMPLQQSPAPWQPCPAPPHVSPQVPLTHVCRPGQSASTQHWWQA
jgi:hypothetical protein